MTKTVKALDAAYGGLSDLVLPLTEDQSWSANRCRSWVVRDLILHLLGDAQRALVALARPVDQRPDKMRSATGSTHPARPTQNPVAFGPSAAWPASPVSAT